MSLDNFIIVSYYTIGTPYQQVAHELLMPSVALLGIPSDIRAVPSLGSWHSNTGYKPVFIRQMLEITSKDLVFVDCDAEIKAYPELFNRIPPDYSFAAHTLDRNKWYAGQAEGTELLSGTLFIRNNLQARYIVAEWAQRAANSREWEQRVLAAVLKDRQVKTFDLPLEYCYIATLPDGSEPHIKLDNPIIVHHQRSRKLKAQIK